VSRVGVVLREGLIFGAIAGVFVLAVRLVAFFATNDLTPAPLADFVTSALTLLIVGSAARKLAATTRETTPGLQMGAIAGGISELFRTLVADNIIYYVPVGRAAFNRLSPAAQRAATDTQSLIVNLSLDLALAVLFGALIGWLGAWSLLRFQPPREPKA
jgi:riboflavin transporter FmnP